MRTPLFLALATVVAAYFSTMLAAFALAVPVIGPILAPAILIGVEAVSYPLTLFVTFIHESGHAVAALLTGGSVTGMGIGLRGDGLTSTLTSGFWSIFIVTNAGYLAGVLYGAFVLFWTNRFGGSAKVFRITAAVIACCTVLFTVFAHGPTAGGLTVSMRFFALAIGVALTAFFWTVPKWVKNETSLDYVLNLLAVACLLRALGDIRNVFVISSGNLADNDATALAGLTGIPGPIWAIAWAAFSAFLIWKAFKNMKG